MAGDVVRIEGRAGERADAVGGLAGRSRPSPASAASKRSGRNTAFAAASSSPTAAPAPSAPSAHRARPPAPDRDAPRRRGRSADSGRSSRIVPSGATFMRPSSVRRITSARRRCGSARPGSRRPRRGWRRPRRRPRRGDARAPAAAARPDSPPPSGAHRQHLLGRARQDLGHEMQDEADAEIDRDRIPRRADAEAVDMPVGEALDHVGRRQHDQPHVLVGIDAAGRHPEAQMIIVRGERERHAEGERLLAAALARWRPRARARAPTPSDR